MYVLFLEVFWGMGVCGEIGIGEVGMLTAVFGFDL